MSVLGTPASDDPLHAGGRALESLTKRLAILKANIMRYERRITAPTRHRSARVDGRALRTARTRSNILTVYLALVRGNLVEPSSREVADVAGCGLRSYYTHFPGLHHMRLAALDHLLGMSAGTFVTSPERADRLSRWQAIIRFQLDAYEKWGPLCLLLTPLDSNPEITERLERLRHHLAAERFERLYRDEFVSSIQAPEWVQILSAAMSLENWQRLYYWEQRSNDSICAQWARWAASMTSTAPDL